MQNVRARQMRMLDLKSLNFEPLRSSASELANMGGYAEQYAHSDPEGSLVKLRSFAERLVDHLYLRLRLPKAPSSKFSDLLVNGGFEAVVDRDARDKLHLLRKLGNKAAHGEAVSATDSARGVYEAWQLARWFHVAFLGGKIADFQEYKAPPPEGIDSKADLKRKVKDLAERHANVEARLKQTLEELEQLRAADADRAKFEGLPTSLTETQTRALLAQSHQATQQLRFTEDHTRRWMIDRDLHAAGWVVPTQGASSDQVGQEVEVRYQSTPTGLGYADYVLWDDNHQPLAVVEAKKTMVDARVLTKLLLGLFNCMLVRGTISRFSRSNGLTVCARAMRTSRLLTPSSICVPAPIGLSVTRRLRAGGTQSSSKSKMSESIMAATR